MKRFFTLLLVGTLIFACKSEKKEATEAAEESVEAVSEAADESAAAEESAEATDEAAGEAAGEAAEEGGEEAAEEGEGTEEEEDKLVVYYPRDSKLARETEEAIIELYKSNPSIEKHFHEQHAFAVFPKITKGGLGVGGAGGKGLVFENYRVIGGTSLAQATLGLQAGGQQYMEVIFFENKEALDRYKAEKVKFSGQASAVALKDGASADIDYQDGVAVFTKAKGGLMAEASLGGQKFKYKDGVN